MAPIWSIASWRPKPKPVSSSASAGATRTAMFVALMPDHIGGGAIIKAGVDRHFFGTQGTVELKRRRRLPTTS